MHSGLSTWASPVIHIYNVLRLPELYEYCDALGTRVIELILSEPSYLAIDILPPKTRKFIAARLLNYCNTECRIDDKASRLSLARYIDEMTSPADPEKIKAFMLFTNDLDRVRGQNFRRTHPELVELLAEDGFDWIDGTLFANPEQRRSPARERDYASL